MDTEKRRESNYDRLREEWRKKFLEMDQAELVRKFQMECDAEAIYLEYYSHRIRIDRKSGTLCYADRPEKTLPFNTVMGIYNMFYYAAKNPVASGNMVPFREVKRVYPFEQAYRNHILKLAEQRFSGRVDLLKAACEALNGTPLLQGDAGYLIPVFPFLNIALFFWDGDEEFPAKANMLFDSNITDFMHEENVVGIASDLVYYLMEAAHMEGMEAYG